MILDTSALSAFVGGKESVGGLLRQQPRASIPVTILGEFRYGIAQSRYRRRYEQWLTANLPELEILAVTSETTIACAAVHTTPKRLGRPIPANYA